MDPNLQVASWPWYYVAVYFFLGGVAAGAYLIAAIADIFGDERDHPIVSSGHYVALVFVLLCPILLILDLGQPVRFWRMLTQFKLLSAVSLGSWALLLFGLFATVSALIWLAREGRLRTGFLSFLGFLERPLLALPRKLIAIIGGFFGIFVAGYTGVLLSTTAIPFWSSNQLLGISFLTSALSSALAVLAIVLVLRGQFAIIPRRSFRDLWLIVLGFELFLVTWELFHEGGSLLMEGQFFYTFVIGVGVIGVLIPLLLLAWNIGKLMNRVPLMIVAVMVLVGGFLFRYSVLVAGQQSVSSVGALLLSWLT